MKTYKKITDLIGRTPLLELETVSKKTGAVVLGKLEYFNPAGSVKDRIAKAMIDDAEEKGKYRNRSCSRRSRKRLSGHSDNARNNEHRKKKSA